MSPSSLSLGRFHLYFISFLQCDSIACYAEHCISYDRFRLSICLSDRPSQSDIVSKRLKLRSCGLHCNLPGNLPGVATGHTSSGVVVQSSEALRLGGTSP